jgi:predicted transcriptional regulator
VARKPVNYNLDASVVERLNTYADREFKVKSRVVQQAIAAYLDSVGA